MCRRYWTSVIGVEMILISSIQERLLWKCVHVGVSHCVRLSAVPVLTLHGGIDVFVIKISLKRSILSVTSLDTEVTCHLKLLLSSYCTYS